MIQQLTRIQNYGDIFTKWDHLLADVGRVVVTYLPTSIGRLSFAITKTDETGFIGQIDEPHSELPESYYRIKDALAARGIMDHNLYLYIDRKTGSMSLRVLQSEG